MRDREVSRNKNKGTDKQVIANTHTHIHKVVQREKTKHTQKTIVVVVVFIVANMMVE